MKDMDRSGEQTMQLYKQKIIMPCAAWSLVAIWEVKDLVQLTVKCENHSCINFAEQISQSVNFVGVSFLDHMMQIS